MDDRLAGLAVLAIASQMERILLRGAVSVERGALEIDLSQVSRGQAAQRLAGWRDPNRIAVAHAQVPGRAEGVAAFEEAVAEPA